MIEAAAKQGAGHVVMHTAVRADCGDTGTRLLDNKTPIEQALAATDVNDIVRAAVRFLGQEPANRGFDIHVPGGITGRQIAEAASRVLGRDVAYQTADVPARDYVEPFPVSPVHKDLYAKLFDYFKATTCLGDPQPITGALPGFRITGVEDFLRGELFAGN